MKHIPYRMLAIVSLMALVAGCESPSKATGTAAVPVETRSPVTASTGSGTAAGTATGATAAGAPQSGVSTVDLTPRSGAGGAAAGSALMAAPAQRVVYFDFDSFVIKDEFQGLLDGHAKVLTRTSGKRMVIEGHTDERGGREYNLALGQKRAEAVVKSLALLGVPESQLEAVSFGEERPAVSGADETAWARNRRAELKDR
ncbi:MAG: peptidoglycan-associated lipoprotein Pal [Rubrivivax sp.]|nr:peptidoglycan-associated lipoprotein Pal [Rubrivivax sp.]